jgi:hypothetical protein
MRDEKDLKEEHNQADDLMQQLMDELPAERRERLVEDLSESAADQVLEHLEEEQLHAGDGQFAKALSKQMQQEKPGLLSEEEKSFFFDKSDQGHVEVEAIEEDDEIYRKVMISPEISRLGTLLKLNIALVALIIMLVGGVLLSFNAVETEYMEINASLKSIEDNTVNKLPKAVIWDLADKPASEKKKILLDKIDSTLAKASEKKLCYYLLAGLAYEEGDFEQGRKYLLKGVKLENENK